VFFSAIPQNGRHKPTEWDSQRGGIVENVKAPVSAVSACVRLFVELLLEGPSRVDANDVAAGRPGEATQRKPFGEELM
jgi:hypothetical protein